MLRADLMPACHRRHDRAWRKRFRDDPTLVRVTPPSPATNATANLDAPSRRGSVNYMVDHICEPMPSTGSHLPNYAARCKMGERHRLRPSQSLGTRSIPICCAASKSHGRTRSGRWTSPTSRWHAASSIWPWYSTGSAAACCRGGCRSRWTRRSAWRHWKTRWRVTASRTSSTPTRAASLPGRPSPARSPTTALRSAWTAKAPGGTTCSSSGYGEASNTRRCTCEPTTACPRPALRSAAIWTSTTVADRMRALTASHPIKPTSPRCPSAWQPNHGRGSTYRRGKSVQTTGTTSIDAPELEQRGGCEAREFLTALIGGRKVWIDILMKMDTGKPVDRYGRVVAVAYL